MSGIILLVFALCIALFFLMVKLFGIIPDEVQPLEKQEDIAYHYKTFKFNKTNMIPGDVLHLTVFGTKLRYEPDRAWSPDRALKVIANDGTHWFLSDGEQIAPAAVVSTSGGGGPK
ncbi:MAG: hypothetical protein ACYSW8_11115 [Planctomycetota bacterium]